MREFGKDGQQPCFQSREPVFPSIPEIPKTKDRNLNLTFPSLGVQTEDTKLSLRHRGSISMCRNQVLSLAVTRYLQVLCFRPRPFRKSP